MKISSGYQIRSTVVTCLGKPNDCCSYSWSLSRIHHQISMTRTKREFIWFLVPEPNATTWLPGTKEANYISKYKNKEYVCQELCLTKKENYILLFNVELGASQSGNRDVCWTMIIISQIMSLHKETLRPLTKSDWCQPESSLLIFLRTYKRAIATRIGPGSMI